jgi:hypothetical protein
MEQVPDIAFAWQYDRREQDFAFQYNLLARSFSTDDMRSHSKSDTEGPCGSGRWYRDCSRLLKCVNGFWFENQFRPVSVHRHKRQSYPHPVRSYSKLSLFTESLWHYVTSVLGHARRHCRPTSVVERPVVRLYCFYFCRSCCSCWSYCCCWPCSSYVSLDNVDFASCCYHNCWTWRAVSRILSLLSLSMLLINTPNEDQRGTLFNEGIVW